MTGAMPLAAVRDLMLAPNRADDDPDAPSLSVDLATGRSVTEADIASIASWLASQTLPVVGTHGSDLSMTEATAQLCEAVDVRVNTDEEFQQADEAIRRNPTAAAVLVQVLRTVPLLPVTQALAVESLAYATLQGGAEFSRWLAARPAVRAHHSGGESPVLLDRHNGHLVITLNAPENRNALSVPMRDALTEAFTLVAMDSSIAAVDVVANGPCFSAGGDLSEFGSIDDIAMAHRIRSLRMPAQYLAPHAARYTFHLHGACIGAGIELPAFAGRLVARPDTRFRLPEVAMGLIPGAGGCVSISRRIGRQRTAWMAITGKDISVNEALEWGLVDSILN